jgi:hypothetical protein
MWRNMLGVLLGELSYQEQQKGCFLDKKYGMEYV